MRRLVFSVVLTATALACLVAPTVARSADDETTSTTAAMPTSTLPVAPAVPTTIPDDFLTLFPQWSNDVYDYLDPGASASSAIPATGRNMALLALLSAAAIVTGAGLSFGARSRVRRR